jgi:hypothetical protein
MPRVERSRLAAEPLLEIPFGGVGWNQLKFEPLKVVLHCFLYNYLGRGQGTVVKLFGPQFRPMLCLEVLEVL